MMINNHVNDLKLLRKLSTIYLQFELLIKQLFFMKKLKMIVLPYKNKKKKKNMNKYKH